MNDIGKNIKRFRSDKDITQEQLAERLHVTRQAVSNWENGKTQPDVQTLSALAECFEITVEELIYVKQAKEKKSVIIREKTIEKTTEKGIDIGAAVGVALAVILSYTKWQSIGWAIFHGLLNWAYVIYYVIKY